MPSMDVIFKNKHAAVGRWVLGQNVVDGHTAVKRTMTSSAFSGYCTAWQIVKWHGSSLLHARIRGCSASSWWMGSVGNAVGNTMTVNLVSNPVAHHSLCLSVSGLSACVQCRNVEASHSLSLAWQLQIQLRKHPHCRIGTSNHPSLLKRLFHMPTSQAR